jgi:uncharacterized protein (TIGR02246 family)
MLSASVYAADTDVLQRLQDKAEIEALIARYVTALDTLDADAYENVFAPDADLEVAGTAYHGRSEIRKIVTGLHRSNAAAEAGRPALYHVLSNTAIEVTGADEARHQSYWQTVRVESGGAVTVGAMGRYEDTLVKRNGTWMIQTRKIVPFTN